MLEEVPECGAPALWICAAKKDPGISGALVNVVPPMDIGARWCHVFSAMLR